MILSYKTVFCFEVKSSAASIKFIFKSGGHQLRKVKIKKKLPLCLTLTMRKKNEDGQRLILISLTG